MTKFWPDREGDELPPPSYRVEISSENGKVEVDVRDGRWSRVENGGTAKHTEARGLRVLAGLARLDPVREFASSPRVYLVTFEGAGLASLLSCVRPLIYEKPTAKIFARFVPELDWVLAETGIARNVCRYEDGLTVVVETPQRESGVEARGASRDVPFLFIMLTTCGLWGMRVHDCIVATGSTNPRYAFARLTEGTFKGPSVVFESCVMLALLVVHHVRMMLGVEFASRDTSFGRAKLQYPRDERRRKLLKETLLLAFIVSLSLILTFSVSSPNPLWVMLSLTLQATSLLVYDFMFYKAFTEFDRDRRANTIILSLDLLLWLWSSAICVAAFLQYEMGNGIVLGVWARISVIFVVPVYVFFTLIEIGKVYSASLRRGLADMRAIVKAIL